VRIADSADHSAIRNPQSAIQITDFGLAKVDGSADATRSGAVLGTPAYMAPEQAAGRAEAVGPAADLWALGAILYELLAGRPPFRRETDLATLRAVELDEPVPPRRLRRDVPRDLEAVCLTCLEKRPDRRYPTATALAADLNRFLAGESVVARHIGRRERFARWCRRNPALAGVSGLAAAAVLVGFVAVAWQWRRAERNLAETGRQYRRAEENFRWAQEAVEQLLSEVGEGLADVPRLEPVRRRLLEKALQLHEEFLGQKGDDPAVRLEAARAHRRAGDIRAMLGQREEAVRAYSAAVALLDAPPVGSDDEEERARALFHRANVRRALRQGPDAEEDYRQALAVLDGLIAAAPEAARHRLFAASCQQQLGIALEQAQRFDEAERAYRAALARLEPNPFGAADHPEYRDRLAVAHNSLGVLLRATGRPREAGEHYAIARDHLEALTRSYPDKRDYREQLADTVSNLGNLAAGRGDLAAAEAAYRRAVAVYQGLADDFPDVPGYREKLAAGHFRLGYAWKQQGKLTEALDAYRKAAAVQQQLADESGGLPRHRAELAKTRNNLGVLLAQMKRLAEAETATRQALALYEPLAAAFPSDAGYQSGLALSLGNLALWRRQQDHPAEAVPLHRRAVEHHEAARAINPRHPGYTSYLRTECVYFATTLTLLGRHDEAARLADRVPTFFPRRGPDAYAAAALLARCAALAGQDADLPEPQRHDRARDYADRAMAWLRQAVERGYNDVKQVRTDPTLEPLRARADYRELLDKLDKRAAGQGTEAHPAPQPEAPAKDEPDA
jgi:tetratricopeptide (TPR) repeat protein